MPTNALLVRWHGGWREVLATASIGTYGRREALLGLGAVQSAAEVDRVAGQQLAIYADVREEIATDLAPMGDDDTPFLSFRVGDHVTVPSRAGITAERVQAITVSETDVGEITYAIDLKDVILGSQERTLEAIKKMADGTSLDPKVATPVSGISSSSDCCPPQASKPGAS